MRPTRTHWLSGRRSLALVVALGGLLLGVVALRALASTEVTLERRHAASAGTRPASGAPTSNSSGVVTDGSKSSIEIGLSYAGEQLQLFGTLGTVGGDAVIVKVLSPPETVKLNQKGRVGPFWMSVKQHSVENVPFMYLVNASKKLDSIVSAEVLRELGIGLDALRDEMRIHTTKGTSEPRDADIIFDGLIRLKKDQGLYQVNDDARVSIKEGKLFRHVVDFPSAAKEGDYLVQTYVFDKGGLVGTATDRLHVRKVGLEAHIVHWAKTFPNVYGVCAVILALGAGLLVGFVFRKGGHH